MCTADQAVQDCMSSTGCWLLNGQRASAVVESGRLVTWLDGCWLISLSLLISPLQPLRLDIKRKLTARSDRVKSVDLHPTEPWMVVSLYSGTLVVWNHESQVTISPFHIPLTHTHTQSLHIWFIQAFFLIVCNVDFPVWVAVCADDGENVRAVWPACQSGQVCGQETLGHRRSSKCLNSMRAAMCLLKLSSFSVCVFELV